MADTNLTQFERAFRIWILLSAIAYAFAVPFFLFDGVWIVPVINSLSSTLFPSMPLYPVPPDGIEGAFWRVLSVSMMAMLTWIAWAIYRDVRGNGRLVVIILLSKSCSTLCYTGLFIMQGSFAYLVGAITDGPIFLATLVLWFLALPADRFLAPKEERILAVIGNALIPRGGAFRLGYLDRHEESLEEVRKLLAAQDARSQILSRFLFHVVNFAPFFVTGRIATLLSLPECEIPPLLIRMENHRFALPRILAISVKTFTLLPFFNQPAAANAVGYDPQARVRS